ncbi:MAG: hypothetical protein H0T13_06930 [Actinobacteria bacterium]|nr:hypothetical protein [Actinomycetota bacterium]
MGVVDREGQRLEDILRLRRAERRLPADEDLIAVRLRLESEVGPTVTRAAVARLLGVSHTALRRWIARGDLPVVLDTDGKQRIPLPAALDWAERTRAGREIGARRSHVLEPAVLEDRRSAERLRADQLVEVPDQPESHERAALRSLAYHRAVAKQLRRPVIDQARSQLRAWVLQGKIDERYADAWEEVLRGRVSDVRLALGEDSQRMRDLRQNSPFAGSLPEQSRLKILQAVR